MTSLKTKQKHNPIHILIIIDKYSINLIKTHAHPAQRLLFGLYESQRMLLLVQRGANINHNRYVGVFVSNSS